MALFPLFVDLNGKKCVVIGGGNIALRKIEALLDFQCKIIVVSPEINKRIEELKWQNKLIVIKKKYSSEDIEDAFLAVAATDKPAVNLQIYKDASEKNILVNVADNHEKCTFVFPSIVRRKDMVIGIATSGGYPELIKRISSKLEGAFPVEYGDMMELLKQVRNHAEKDIEDIESRRRILDRILDEVFFYENAITLNQMERRINEIFEEYKISDDLWNLSGQN